ncbi:hypothetical protein LCM4579_25845 [Ensifer sp. LCM 4579]|nr:hypothetical protein LCM4579_25845 [Ensifer sp. LCM 4579]
MRRIIPAAAVAAILPPSAWAAQGDDPDWPCIQRKVPTLSLGQVWTGPELPQSAADWSRNAAVAALVAEVAARRVPLPHAQQKIREFAEGLPKDERKARMYMLAQGLFDHLNRERSEVIAGIARYAHRQRDNAQFLRQEASAVDALRAKADTDPNELEFRSNRLALQTRIFQERARSLSYVCEVPTLIEQRLFALARTISEILEAK